jgi:DNA-binding protein HU-beta
MPIKRTVMRSSKGTKLYAVRDAKGRFKDIQSYKKAHSMDIKRKSKAEKAKPKAKPKAKAKKKK